MGCISYLTPPRLRAVVAGQYATDVRLRNDFELAELHRTLLAADKHLPTYFDGRLLLRRVEQEQQRRLTHNLQVV